MVDDQAAMIGFRVHRALGMTYGAGAALLIGAGIRPLVAGITPPPQAHMMESHLRHARRRVPAPCSRQDQLAGRR
jgi:hypothetical protein